MAKGILDGDPLGRVKGQQLLEQIQGQVVALGEEGAEGNLLLKGERADVLACAAGLDAVVVFHGWCAENVQDEGELVMIYTTRVSGLAR